MRAKDRVGQRAGGKSKGKSVDGRNGSGDDGEAKRSERLTSRTKAMSAGLATFGLLDPGAAPEGSPSGQVTLGEKSGALAPMLAFDVLNKAATAVATAAADAKGSSREAPELGVVLVTEDPALLRSDLLSQQVHAVLTQWTRALDLAAMVEKAREDFDDAGRRKALGNEEVAHIETTLPVPAETLAPTATAGEADDSKGEPAPASGAAEAAVASVGAVLRDLVQLTAVDYTLTAVAVSPAAGLLARLTAGHLGGKDGQRVVLDGFGRVDVEGETMKLFNDVQTKVRVARQKVAGLEQLIAGRKAAVGALQLEADFFAEKWAAAVADKDIAAERAEKLKAMLDDRRSTIATKRVGLAPAQTVVEYGAALIAAAQKDLESLVVADSAGTSMLLRACSREGLHAAAGDDDQVVRVLCVEAPHLGADVVTRHSVLGSSGRVGFLGAASVAWVLLDAQSGQVVGGGGQAQAAQLTYDLDTAKTLRAEVDPNGTATLGDDPLRAMEDRMRLVVMLAAVAVLLIGVAAVFGVVHLWLPYSF